MRIVIAVLFCMYNFSGIYAQSKPYIVFKHVESSKKVKLFFDIEYELKIKDNFLGLLPDTFVSIQKELGSVAWNLENASLDTLYFRNGQHICINNIEWIFRRASYSGNIIPLFVDLLLLTYFNYLLLKSNEPIA